MILRSGWCTSQLKLSRKEIIAYLTGTKSKKFQSAFSCCYGLQCMSATFRRPPLPVWKNSPIKTAGAGLLKVDISAKKKAKRETRRSPDKTQPASATNISQFLRDASNMFDDDEDHVETSQNIPVHRSVERTTEHESSDGLKRGDMALLFGSPDTTAMEDDSQVSGSVLDPEVSVDEPITVQAAAVSNRASLSEMLHSITLPAPRGERSRHSSVSTINLAHNINGREDIAEHVRFLTDFEVEFSGRSGSKSSSAGDRACCEAEILRKLEAYVRLPGGVLHAMVLKQHEELVQMGLFDSPDESPSAE
jgi:hypothetical protein